MARYTVRIENLEGTQRWELTLYSAEPHKENAVEFSAVYEGRENLPELAQIKMTLIDMADDVNPRARMLDGIGTRYFVREKPVYEGGTPYTHQYFLHDITLDDIKQMRLISQGELT